MKKGKLKKILASGAMGIMALAMPFALTGCDKDSDINVRVNGEYVQWQVDGEDSWTNLLSIDEIKDLLGESYKGDTGAKGEQGNPGINGKEVEFRNNGEYIQWRYIEPNQGQDDNWEDLITLSSLKGESGDNGKDSSFAEYTITYDYGKANTYFKTQQTTDTVKSTEWLTTLPEIKSEYVDSFRGWFVEGTAKQIENYDFVGGNATLEARFNIEQLGVAGLYQNGKYVMTWADIKTAYPDAIVDGEIKNNSERSYFENLTGDLIIDDEVTILGDYCFAFCNKLTSITIPTSVTNIGKCALNSCRKISGILIPTTVTSIGDSAFWCCGLKSITIPASVTSIGSNAFRGCGELASITVEEGNAVYDSRDNCNAIIKKSTNELVFGCKETIIPTSVTSIEDYAFMDNYGLTSITIPTGVISIQYSAFRGCINLTRIIIPTSVTSIEDYAFGQPSRLNNVYYLGTSDAWNTIDIKSNNNESIMEATVYYFIENQENVPNDGGKYWHYDTDGKTPIVW